MSKDNFLDIPEEPKRPFQDLFIEAQDEIKGLFDAFKPEGSKTPVKTKTIQPSQGFCVKVKGLDDEKVFLNICYTPELPEPKEISEAELIAVIESPDPSSYKVPLSLGLPHEEADKGGHPCKAYDIIINEKFFHKIANNELFKTFLITVAMDGIEDKYGVNVVRESFVVLKNKKYLGTMPEHCIQDRAGPLIAEVESSTGKQSGSKSSSKIAKTGKKPDLHLTKHTLPGQPDTLVARIPLPGVKSVQELLLDIGEDRIVLGCRKPAYYLDVFVPYLIIQDQSAAEFNVSNQVLTVMMPLEESSEDIPAEEQVENVAF